MLKESIRMAWDNIINNKMRSFLTALGIMIGVTAVIALITVVQGVSNEMMAQFSELGVGKVTVQATGTPLKQGLTDAEVDKLANIESISGVSPLISGTSSVAADSRVDDEATIQGRNNVYYSHNDRITLGRGFTEIDMQPNSNVCIITETTAQELFPGENPVGAQVRVGGKSYQVIGIESDQDNSIMSSLSADDDNLVVTIPYRNAMRLLGISNIVSLEVFVADTADSSAVVNKIEQHLDTAFNNKEDSYFIINMDSLLDTMESMQNMMTIMLAGIASISLLVGGIGIMNMMLTSVSERTKEIGLRKALGAEPSQIQQQFLVEAIFLSLLGGIVGVILGLVLSYVISLAIGMPFVPSTFAILLGVGFSAAVGIIFGVAPAKKASELNPIDALRSE